MKMTIFTIIAADDDGDYLNGNFWTSSLQLEYETCVGGIKDGNSLRSSHRTHTCYNKAEKDKQAHPLA